jgi:microsomal dipeptidase-like Zn-dependent dipeptidase
LSPGEVPNGGRLRTWEEMEMIAATGGLVCTWPLKWVNAATGTGRLTLNDWAEENYRMMERLGGEHIGLGTDGGGVLPERVDGYQSLLDLPALIEAMVEVGFHHWEIDLYMGKNMFRVLKECIG